MKKSLSLAMCLLLLCSCNYNHYDRDTDPYRGQIQYQHLDETAQRPTGLRTTTVKRDLTTTEGGTVKTRTVTEEVSVPVYDNNEDNTEVVTKAQRAVNADRNYYEVNINENKTYQKK